MAGEVLGILLQGSVQGFRLGGKLPNGWEFSFPKMLGGCDLLLEITSSLLDLAGTRRDSPGAAPSMGLGFGTFLGDGRYERFHIFRHISTLEGSGASFRT